MSKRKEGKQSAASPWFLSRAKDANFAEYVPLWPHPPPPSLFQSKLPWLTVWFLSFCRSCGHYQATKYVFLHLSEGKTGKDKKVGVVLNVRTTKKTPGVLALEVNWSTIKVHYNKMVWEDTMEDLRRGQSSSIWQILGYVLFSFLLWGWFWGGGEWFCFVKERWKRPKMWGPFLIPEDSRILRDPKCEKMKKKKKKKHSKKEKSNSFRRIKELLKVRLIREMMRKQKKNSMVKMMMMLMMMMMMMKILV